MQIVSKQIKQIFAAVILTGSISPVFTQVKPPVKNNKAHVIPVKHTPATRQLSAFIRLAAQANVSFTFPNGFKEIPAPDNEYFSYDYAMTIPGKDFEIWLQVKSQKENWASYEKARNLPDAQQLANPDSSYIPLARAQCAAFAGDNPYSGRVIPPDILARYNADNGKSYLLTLRDMQTTKRYKYALLITLQKDHTGIIMAVCFTNDKSPEFFKNMDKASNCLKFKP
ncbi:hypothetical protein [Mucilaginibacter sp. L3T2-6]|uniref:hypothetical protein n=1 Tax=Mucilaginibacter sp. L3T2-6 TaxID=3062491 RepID=UPI0026756613|nr:hypothetical protein [Mucilaginibacter sp. L3T2-6]MDO3641409.1 hypothetical protein [Mucilaginibacter sp. L3T2-6]MDV6213830.1 hypothetical protein [Mucilaginibacter sp. L3T2-6]